MSELERFLHDEALALPVLVKAGLAHVQFETIHPFLDGNGQRLQPQAGPRESVEPGRILAVRQHLGNARAAVPTQTSSGACSARSPRSAISPAT